MLIGSIAPRRAPNLYITPAALTSPPSAVEQDGCARHHITAAAATTTTSATTSATRHHQHDIDEDDCTMGSVLKWRRRWRFGSSLLQFCSGKGGGGWLGGGCPNVPPPFLLAPLPYSLVVIKPRLPRVPPLRLLNPPRSLRSPKILRRGVAGGALASSTRQEFSATSPAGTQIVNYGDRPPRLFARAPFGCFYLSLNGDRLNSPLSLSPLSLSSLSLSSFSGPSEISSTPNRANCNYSGSRSNNINNKNTMIIQRSGGKKAEGGWVSRARDGTKVEQFPPFSDEAVRCEGCFPDGGRRGSMLQGAT